MVVRGAAPCAGGTLRAPGAGADGGVAPVPGGGGGSS